MALRVAVAVAAGVAIVAFLYSGTRFVWLARRGRPDVGLPPLDAVPHMTRDGRIVHANDGIAYRIGDMVDHGDWNDDDG